MKIVILLVELAPFLGVLYGGMYAIAEVFFPSLRDSNFNRWEVDEGGGSYVRIMGWRKVLTPPRVMARGYMSDRAACAVAILLGSVLILIGMFGIRHISGFPRLIPDPFGKVWTFQ